MSQELLDAVAAVSGKVDAVQANLQAEIVQINAALAALQQPDPDVAAAIEALTGIGSRLDAVNTEVGAIIPDAPPSE